MTQPTEIHTLAGAYALDALTEFERASFSRHVSECGACALEVAELRETAARLGAAAWEAPPPSLRANVMAEIARTRQIAPGRPDVAHGEVAVRRWRRVSAAAVAAGVVAVAGIGATWVVEENRVRDAQRQAQALEQQVTAMIGTPDATLYTATATGGGRVTVAVSPTSGQAVALMAGLPAPPSGQVYQLWLIRDGKAASAGVLAAGQSSALAPLGSVTGVDAFGVTVEPGPNGSALPSPDRVATVPLA